MWEWVADFYCEDYAAGPADGSARLADDCPTNGGHGLRVLRGGSVFYKPELMRAAMRVQKRPRISATSASGSGWRGHW